MEQVDKAVKFFYFRGELRLLVITSSLTLQEKEMEKQRLLYQQSRLHNRGAAEMVLQMISACKGTSFSLYTYF